MAVVELKELSIINCSFGDYEGGDYGIKIDESSVRRFKIQF